ncbi:MAG: hypothetical protein ABSG67_13075 [Thermoguttaceae bacterium]
MSEMWAMAEEVYELKGICKTLGKPYEVEAIKLCAGETAFHYLRDLYTAFTGNRQKALECAKAPYTLLREFRAERAANNRKKKCPDADQDLDLIPTNRRHEIPNPGVKLALPTESSSALKIEMSPQVIDVVDESPGSVSTIGQPLATDDDVYPDTTTVYPVDELAQYKDAKEKAEAFIRCPLFDGDVHKALDFLRSHYIEKPANDNSAALPEGKKKTSRAKKQATTNPADTPWPPPITCEKVPSWEKAKKGQYVTWGGMRVMVIDDIRSSEIVLEDPFHPKGTYPISVTRETWGDVLGTTEKYVTSEFVGLCSKVPTAANVNPATTPLKKPKNIR